MPAAISTSDFFLILAPLAPGVVASATLSTAQPVAAGALLVLAAGLSLSVYAVASRRARSAAAIRGELDELESANARLRAELNDRRAVFDASDTPVLIFDASGSVVYASPTSSEFFGKARDAIVGRSIDDLFTHKQVLEAHARAQNGQSSMIQIRHASPTGQIRIYQIRTQNLPVVHKSQSITDTAGGALISIRDITEIAAAAHLKTEFVASASHELRTPLASIRAATETLADGAWEEPPMRKRLTTICLSNIGRLEALVRDLLDLSRFESGVLEPVLRELDLHAFISRMVEDFQPLAKARGVAIEAHFADNLPVIQSDARLLELVLRNLIDNATKFAYRSTAVRVECDQLPDSRGVRLRVIDQGVGIPLVAQQHIFERFFQTDAARSGEAAPDADKAARRGTGLGLALAKHAVLALGGTISVQSIWKQGTTMTVELPMIERTAEH
jgi:PAS domain S-box-containing protein